MCEFIKPKKLAFKKQKSIPSKQQFNSLLSKEVEQPKNLPAFRYNEVRIL